MSFFNRIEKFISKFTPFQGKIVSLRVYLCYFEDTSTYDTAPEKIIPSEKKKTELLQGKWETRQKNFECTCFQSILTFRSLYYCFTLHYDIIYKYDTLP